jgi:hypothetical protein
MASSAAVAGVRMKDLVAVRWAQRGFHARWPRGPRVDIAREAAAAVENVIGERRPRVVKPQWVMLPQWVAAPGPAVGSSLATKPTPANFGVICISWDSNSGASQAGV